MKVEFTLLRTRVARRMLMLFLFCAVVPIITLAAITYPIEVARVNAGHLDQLRSDGKGAGMLILARLEALAAALQVSGWDDGNAGAPDLDGPFSGIAIESGAGVIRVTLGNVGPLPTLNSTQAARLVAGKPVLIPDSSGDERGYYLVVRTASGAGAYARTWGHLTLASTIAGLEIVRDGIGFCVHDQRGSLGCNTTRGVARDSTAQLIARWPIFLKNEFGAPAWTVTVTESRSDVLAALADFRRSFALGLVFAVILVFVLSHIQIRRRMTPLADLEAGTRRLRAGDFASRVTIESDDEFESLGTAFNQMATDLERQFTTLSSLHNIDHAALRDHSAGAIAAAALQGAAGLLCADVVAVATAGPSGTSAWRVDVVTRHAPSARVADTELTAEHVSHLDAAGSHLHLSEGETWPAYCSMLGDHGCREMIIFPIRGQSGSIGVLIVGRRDPTASLANLLTTGGQLAGQLALGLSNVSLLEELDSLSLGALTALARTIDASSHWTAGHSERVTEYAVAIATGLGIGAPDLARLRQGSLLHDIGKIGVPPAILDKAGPLNEAELEVMQSHPTIGARIVESVRAFRDLVPLVLHHHELLDGTGYPAGLVGDEIPVLVRILTVADVFDALTSDRPYREGLTPDSALEILTNGIGVKFDARAVAVLRDLLAADRTPAAGNEASASTITLRDTQGFMGGRRSEQAA